MGGLQWRRRALTCNRAAALNEWPAGQCECVAARVDARPRPQWARMPRSLGRLSSISTSTQAGCIRQRAAQSHTLKRRRVWHAQIERRRPPRPRCAMTAAMMVTTQLRDCAAASMAAGGSSSAAQVDSQVGAPSAALRSAITYVRRACTPGWRPRRRCGRSMAATR